MNDLRKLHTFNKGTGSFGDSIEADKDIAIAIVEDLMTTDDDTIVVEMIESVTDVEPTKIIEAVKNEINMQFTSEEIINEKTRTLRVRRTARQEKKVKNKSQVMKQLNKDPKFQQMQQRLIKYAKMKARQIGRELGVPPNMIDVSRITVRDHN